MNTKGCDKLFMSYERKNKRHLKYFKVWRCLVKVNIPFNGKKSLVIYTNKFLEMFPSNDKLSKFFCDTSGTVLPSSVILFVFFLVMTICPIS